MIFVPFRKLDPRATTPERKSDGASGYDLSCLNDELFQGRETKKIRTGLAFAIPEGYEGQIRLRSSIAASGHYMIPNAPGTIDSDYRGEVCVLLTRYEDAIWEDTLKAGARIAQIIFTPVAHPAFKEVVDLNVTARGAGGFGSTDKNGIVVLPRPDYGEQYDGN